MAGTPRFSVVVATYNWSSALALALQSIRGQTEQDWEALVVGDACTDDSEAVVRSFGDARLRWSNLPQNCGSQWGPNNHALGMARGEYVAYLGHDDLWWPTHLASARATFERTGADVVAAGALLYGPPESGIRSVTGFFPYDTYTPRHFFPPSSMCHRRELAARVGGWRPPEQAKVTVDQDYLVRCQAAGARFAPTREITAFKFNAAWRRDAYRRRDASEQRAFVERMRREGEAFRLRELTDTLHAAAENRLINIEIPPEIEATALEASLTLRAFKGTRPRPPVRSESLPGGRQRFARDDEFTGFEWYALETHPSLGAFRWSGPSRESSIVLPVRIDRPLDVSLLVLGAASDATLRSARLLANRAALDARMAPGPGGAMLWSATLKPEQLPADDRDELRLTICVQRTLRPLELGTSTDRRWLGLAVGRIEIAPAH